jgi:tRNA(Met) cytidine acetyltransferase
LSEQLPVAAQASPDTVLLNCVEGLLRRARDSRQRVAVVLAEQRDRGQAMARQLLQAALTGETVWYGERVPEGVSACFGREAFRLLGREIDVLVFDAWSGFDPDAFGALTGSIRGGGTLLLLTPPLADWPTYPDPQHARITVAPYSAGQISGRFLQRMVRLIRHDPHCLVWDAGRVTQFPVIEQQKQNTQIEDALPAPYRSRDQQRAVDAVLRVVNGHRRRPVVLTSDRGRGKSAAFGIAAARLIEQGRQHIVVTAPSRQAADTLIHHATAIAPRACNHMRFIAPDELIAAPVSADLVLVDEAAAIPTPLLEALLRRYSRIAFATTVHGYEGTGRGFAVRFSGLLDQYSNSWSALELGTPIRWAADDPLERLVFRLLALDAETAPVESFPAGSGAQDFQLACLDRDELVNDETMLRGIFGLLVQAHYRTRPLDLRQLLDGPNLSAYVLCHGPYIAATALVAREGEFDREDCAAIWAGRSRPHGHMLPETLSAHLGLQQAPALRAARIMRLAVHPALQRRGLGCQLIAEIAARAAQDGCDYIGTCFGLTPGLLEFWFQLGWLPVRLSVKKGASSGSHSAVFLHPLSAAGAQLCTRARQRFFAQFPDQLSDTGRDLEPALVAGLLRQGADQAPRLDEADYSDLQAFSRERRLAEVTMGSLRRLAMQCLMSGQGISTLTATERDLLICRVIQKRSWAACVEQTGLAGRKLAVQTLRNAVANLLA